MTRHFVVSMMAAAVLGTVTVVNGKHLDVKDAAGKITMPMLDANTKIKRAKSGTQR